MKKLLQIKSNLDKISYSIEDAKEDVREILRNTNRSLLIDWIMTTLTEDDIIELIKNQGIGT